MLLTNNSVASTSSSPCCAAFSSGSLSESINADFFFFGTAFSASLPESLKTCRFRFSPPTSEPESEWTDADRLRDFEWAECCDGECCDFE